MLDLVLIDGLKCEVRRKSWDDVVLAQELIYNVYHVDKPKVVVDIGSHIGGTAMYCASRGAKVYAYEPSVINYKQLLKHIELNDFQDDIIPFNVAVSDGKDKKLYHHPTNFGCFSEYRDNVSNMSDDFETVKSVTIQEVFKDIEHCDLLKIDCEGGEVDFYKDIPVEKIDQISMELHGREEEEIKEFLKKSYNIQQENTLLICKKH